MKNENKILLPGLEEQLKFFLNGVNVKEKKCLVAGASSEYISKMISLESGEKVYQIVEDYDSLINANLVLTNEDNIDIRMMDFETTDFDSESFDVIYSQASFSTLNRSKIIKEMKRILKPGGILCVGEITLLQKTVPQFVIDIFQTSRLDPIYFKDLNNYYTQRKFEVLTDLDLSKALVQYYKESARMLKAAERSITENEAKYYKKLLNKISHETKSFIKYDADKFVGFHTLILKKHEEK